MKPQRLFHEPRWASGNTLTEYGLIGVLVLLFMIPGINLAGGTMNNLLQGLRQDMASHRNQARQIASLRGAGKPDALRPPEILSTDVPSEPATENPPLSQTVATLGANGATRLAADEMTLLAQKLKDQQEITDEQYNMLIKLAKQGHVLGTIAALMEDAAAHASSSNEFLGSKVNFNGKVIAIYDLSNLLGYRPDPTQNHDDIYHGRANYPVPEDFLNPPYGAYGELQTFLDLYHQTMDKGTFSDPSVKQTVTALSSRIALLNAAIDQIGIKVSAGQITGDQIRDTEVSLVTHMDSASICTTGKGKDSGIACNSDK